MEQTIPTLIYRHISIQNYNVISINIGITNQSCPYIQYLVK